MKKKMISIVCAAILSCAVAVGVSAKTVNAEETSYGTFIKPENLVSSSVKFSQPFGYKWDSLKYTNVNGDGDRLEVCFTNDNRFDLGVSSGYNIGRIPFSQIGQEETIGSFMVSSTFYAGYVDGSDEAKEAPLLNNEMDNLSFVNFGYGFSIDDGDYTPTTISIFFRDVKYLNTASIDIIYRDARYRLMSNDINALAEDFERTGKIKFEFAQIRLDYYGMDKYCYSFALKTDNHCVSYGNFPLTYTLTGYEELFLCENSGSLEGTETRSLGSLLNWLDSKPIHGHSSVNGSFKDYVSLICTGNYAKSEKLPELNYGDFVTDVIASKKYSDVIDVYTQMYNSDHGITDGSDDNPKQDDTKQNDSLVNGFTPVAKRVLAIAFGVTAFVGIFTVTSTIMRGRKRRKGARKK